MSSKYKRSCECESIKCNDKNKWAKVLAKYVSYDCKCRSDGKK